MAEFLDELISVHIRYDNSYQDDYSVEITQTGGSNGVPAQEYRRLVHPYPIRKFSVSYQLDRDELYRDIQALYHRAYGKFAGFRAKNFDDFTTAANHRDAPTHVDQGLRLANPAVPNVWQLRKRYGTDKTGLAVGFPERTIFKPVAGTVKIGLNGVDATGNFVVNAATGIVTPATAKSHAVTGITKAVQAVVSFASHTFVAGESPHFSGVGGMTQINGLRGQIVSVTPTSITLNLNTSGFSTYTSGGTAATAPQVGETITGGCEFDFPVRFDSELRVVQNHKSSRMVEFDLMELLNP